MNPQRANLLQKETIPRPLEGLRVERRHLGARRTRLGDKSSGWIPKVKRPTSLLLLIDDRAKDDEQNLLGTSKTQSQRAPPGQRANDQLTSHKIQLSQGERSRNQTQKPQ
ncbi:hypothetical protein VTN31DRAFT_2186 [Thermomyces dupontii]|uniref:uncharacterized protein n=1 Tax=Talaromyces thermophilus TaxID=28565 RepID=UPI003742E8C3